MTHLHENINWRFYSFPNMCFFFRQNYFETFAIGKYHSDHLFHFYDYRSSNLMDTEKKTLFEKEKTANLSRQNDNNVSEAILVVLLTITKWLLRKWSKRKSENTVKHQRIFTSRHIINSTIEWKLQLSSHCIQCVIFLCHTWWKNESFIYWWCCK